MSAPDLEDLLRKWDALYNAKPVRGRNARRTWPASGGDAAAARQSLRAIADRVPQAVVKITGGGKGSRGIGAHLRYISRNGALPLTDQDGLDHAGKQGRGDILERWENAGLQAEGRFREAFNIVLSPGKGADGESLRRAAEDFAREQFGANHDFVMALHTPDTDPSFNRAVHPHVHLVVLARGHDGRRLNPRKADLFAYRAAFARHLRENGIPSVATRRDARFNARKKGEPQSVHNMRKRGALLDRRAMPEHASTPRSRGHGSEERAREMYVDLVAALAKSQVEDDRALGTALRKVLPVHQTPLPAKSRKSARGR